METISFFIASLPILLELLPEQEKGHDVPADKIRERIPRTLANAAVALKLADNGAWIPVKIPMPTWALELIGG